VSRKAVTIYCNIARDLKGKLPSVIRGCIRRVRRTGCTPTIVGNDFEAALSLLETHLEHELIEIYARYLNRRSTYEPLFSMPPARRPKAAKTGRPLTLVERRAASAKRKVREWQRKSKLASTKIKQYRKKVSYYTKKGVIQ
jgi:hypothetical protein